MLVVDRRGIKNKCNLLHEMQKLVVLAEMNQQESLFEVNRVDENIIKAIQGRFLPETGIHFDKYYQSVEWYVWRELPGDRPEE